MERVYFARAVDGQDRGALLRDASALARDLRVRNIELVDPLALMSPAARTATDIVAHDLDVLRTCDAVMMDMTLGGWTYIGCVCELVYAKLWEIPVVVYVACEELLHRPWLTYHASAVVIGQAAAIVAVEQLIGQRSALLTEHRVGAQILVSR